MTADWLPRSADEGPVLLPGVYDGLGARLAEMAGFRAVYASGGAIARSAALPDIGLLTLTETLDRLRPIVEATSLPVVADFETGFGGPANIRRAAKAFADLGIAAFHLEDQDEPKRCGALPGKRLISVEEMSQKLSIAREAVSNPDVLIVGRTDAVSVEGLDAAIARANAYGRAGADIVYLESLWDGPSIARVAEEVPGPKMISMIGGNSAPDFSARELVEMDFRIVIVPNDLQRAAVFAMQRALELLRHDGHTTSMADAMITMEDREQIARTHDYVDLV
ncbi:isocitrate lyase/PEP mutase family protein [Microbacterium sp.]|uniref:isocitrate lyase/PEP mutase family protein n=1 Tax=Microbacterium sp. TaxID=51671 RepID=UPI0039E428CD